jgi:vitamin B12 transporter
LGKGYGTLERGMDMKAEQQALGPLSTFDAQQISRHAHRIGLIACLLSIATLTTQASDAPINTLEQVQVTASALPTTPAAASQHITVLRREQLDAMRGASVADILATQAGLVVDRSARSGGYGALYLRGADPSHVVILIDHVRQNDPLSSRGSAVDLNTLASDDIERIEIVRGNASVVNAEAMAGLIHIFTRHRDSAGVYGGGDGLRGAQIAWGGDALWASSAQREEGERSEAYYRTRSSNGGWTYDFGDAGAMSNTRVEATGRYSDYRAFGFPDDSGGAEFARLRTLEARAGNSRQFSLRASADAAGAQWSLQAGSLLRRGDERSPGVAPGLRDRFGLPAIDSRTRYRREELQASYGRALAARWSITAGALHQRERAELDSAINLGFTVLPASFALRRSSDSAFAEARWQSDAWTLQGGLRHERAEGSYSATLPMLSLQNQLGSGHGRWGASVARSAKQPSFYALGNPLVGDPNLKPERALHRELFYAIGTDADSANLEAGTWAMRFTLFSARYQDLIDFDAGPPPKLVNRARIESDGLEWQVGRRFASQWRAQLEGAWMRVRDPVGGVALRHRPRLQWAASTGWQFQQQRELSASLRYLGRRFDSSIPTGDRWLGSSTVLDLALRQSLGPVDLRLALDNVLGRDLEESIGSEIDGRRLQLSLQWRLQ